MGSIGAFLAGFAFLSDAWGADARIGYGAGLYSLSQDGPLGTVSAHSPMLHGVFLEAAFPIGNALVSPWYSSSQVSLSTRYPSEETVNRRLSSWGGSVQYGFAFVGFSQSDEPLFSYFPGMASYDWSVFKISSFNAGVKAMSSAVRPWRIGGAISLSLPVGASSPDSTRLSGISGFNGNAYLELSRALSGNPGRGASASLRLRKDLTRLRFDAARDQAQGSVGYLSQSHSIELFLSASF